jgi:hypothetical protein
MVGIVVGAVEYGGEVGKLVVGGIDGFGDGGRVGNLVCGGIVGLGVGEGVGGTVG